MTAVAAIERRVDLLDAFIARAEAWAYLWSIGEYSLQEAVDVLQHDAKRDGLIKRISQDGVQTILADAFRSYHEASNADPKRIVDERDDKPKHNTPAASTIEAFKYVIRQKDPERLRAWLARRSRQECITLKMLATK